MEIKGKFATAICYAKIIEDQAVEQIRRMCDHDFTRGSRIRIMPDVHAGKGCTIGTTMTVVDKVVPNIVGVDIGCGMYTMRLDSRDVDFEKLDSACRYVPSGKNVWQGRQEGFDLSVLRCFRELKDTGRLGRSLGTLGGGNHFIEVDRASDGTMYLVVHTGSRNLGKQVAEHYQDLAVKLNRGYGDYLRKKQALIDSYKAAGRRSEIQSALKALKWTESPGTVPQDLCWLEGEHLKDYLADVEVCQRFAARNRELIARILLDRTGLSASDGFHTVHNYISMDEMILRKGAIAAHAGEKVLIPINMRDGCVLAVGRGNPDWNYSAPHGAGRLLSRSAARAELSMDDYAKAMRGIYTTSVNTATLDESPMAYKSIDDIIDVIADTVDIIDILKPVYNFKASD